MRHRNTCKNYLWSEHDVFGKVFINIFHFPKRQIEPNVKNSTNWTNILHHKDDSPTTFQ